ncbi:MAG TPA: bifunctional diaminohydroxyphosphoribosylaminopyrimidine deaminase/5-amino-6-(5-phosphoribosylamino)uracil reductase RibD [Pyrinomonadaceae bacterium]|nr:bifunctional diaminohydroxyphosphoribosylaminopyrimidine deaminase/5-amino-6-(5-phosphoribosylamino)uracil reductase RibD [Pyrinomonadaceae bacterium]
MNKETNNPAPGPRPPAPAWSESDTRFMRRALELAARGAGQVSPGPLVGCVVVDAAGETIGEGFYVYERVKHAETLALEQAGVRARGATAYVSLEPHAHTGRTPPCTTALINAGVSRVVASIEDPNPLVSGRGFAHLREAGVEVVTGVLAREGARLNEKYIRATREGRPFVHLKLACSLDGRIATRTGDARWITGAESRARVHLLRREYDAILVGAGTALKDDPLLTDRSGLARRRPLARVVLDERLQLPPDSQLARTAHEAPVVVVTSPGACAERIARLEERGVEVVRDPSSGRDLGALLAGLHRRTLHSLLVEGGAHVAGRFLEAGLVDKVSFFVAPVIIGGDAKSAVAGAGAPTVEGAIRLRDIDITRRGDDVEVTGYVKAVNGK